MDVFTGGRLSRSALKREIHANVRGWVCGVAIAGEVGSPGVMARALGRVVTQWRDQIAIGWLVDEVIWGLVVGG